MKTASDLIKEQEQLMKAAKISRYALSKETGIAQSSLSRIFLGHMGVTLETFLKIKYGIEKLNK